MATKTRREGIGRFDFGSQTRGTDGIGDRHEGFLASRRGARLADPLLLLLLPLFLML
jgi:hypothetical protein